jgi:hypothetical protein
MKKIIEAIKNIFKSKEEEVVTKPKKTVKKKAKKTTKKKTDKKTK